MTDMVSADRPSSARQKRSRPRLCRRDSDTALMDERAQQITSSGDHEDSGRMNEGRKAKSPVTRGRGLPTQRSGRARIRRDLWSLRPWTAGLLAALAVRPVPSCFASIPLDVNDQPPSDVYPVQAAYRYLRSVMTLRPDHPYQTQVRSAAMMRKSDDSAMVCCPAARLARQTGTSPSGACS